MTSLESIGNDLSRAWEAAQTQWSQTESTWRDTKSKRFGERYWVPIDREISEYMAGLDELIQAIRRSRQVTD